MSASACSRLTQTNRAASAAATITPSRDAERERARQERQQQFEESERQPRESRRREHDREGGRDVGLHAIGDKRAQMLHGYKRRPVRGAESWDTVLLG